MKEPGPSPMLPAFRLGSAAAPWYLRDVLYWQVAGSFLSSSLDFFASFLMDFVNGVRAGSLAPDTCALPLFGPTGGTNIGIFPDNGGPPRGTGRGAVTNV